jgi:DNA-directed RNA polymerase specialized sigma24 family protein
MDANEFFANRWSALVPGLRAALAKAGAPEADRDDLVQETALRLFGMWEQVDQDRPVAALARRIALNAWRDQWRRRGTREVVGAVPEQASAQDTERAALARVEVGEVSRAFASLRPSTVQVLQMAARAAEGQGVDREPVLASVRMARSRARRALAECLKVASAIVAACVTGVRWLGRPARSATVAGAMVSVALVFAWSLPAMNHTPGPRWDAQPLSAAETPATSTAPATVPVARALHSTLRPAARHHLPKHRTETPSYVVQAGPAKVAVFADVDAFGNGVRLGRPGPGSTSPLCTYGSTPSFPTVQRCTTP